MLRSLSSFSIAFDLPVKTSSAQLVAFLPGSSAGLVSGWKHRGPRTQTCPARECVCGNAHRMEVPWYPVLHGQPHQVKRPPTDAKLIALGCTDTLLTRTPVKYKETKCNTNTASTQQETLLHFWGCPSSPQNGPCFHLVSRSPSCQSLERAAEDLHFTLAALPDGRALAEHHRSPAVDAFSSNALVSTGFRRAVPVAQGRESDMGDVPQQKRPV